jgi:hypothetical protein
MPLEIRVHYKPKLPARNELTFSILKFIIYYKYTLGGTMNSVRVNITLPPEVLSELSQSVGPRQRSRFISDSVVRSLKELKAKRLALEYEEAAAEIRRVNEDLDGTLNDGLD